MANLLMSLVLACMILALVLLAITAILAALIKFYSLSDRNLIFAYATIVVAWGTWGVFVVFLYKTIHQ